MKDRHTIKHVGEALQQAFDDIMETEPKFAAMFKGCRPLSWREDHYRSGKRRYVVRGVQDDGFIVEMKLTVG